MPRYRAVDKSVSIDPFHFEIETIASQEHISSSEGNSLVAVDEPMVLPSDSIKAAASSSTQL